MSNPTSGGSYLRQPDGTLQRMPNDDPAPAPAALKKAEGKAESKPKTKDTDHG